MAGKAAMIKAGGLEAAVQFMNRVSQPDPQRATSEGACSVETRRLEALGRYEILDTLPEQALDDLVTLAAQICDTPVALISLVDDHRQWFKAKVGMALAETPKDVSFCAHAMKQEDLFIVPDARLDSRFSNNPMVTGDQGICFYAGAPLITPEGLALGALCVKDRVPRRLTAGQEQALRVLARQVMTHLELRRHTRELIESQEHLRMVTEKARVGLVMLDRDRRYVYANSTYAEILNLPSRDLVGKRVVEVLSGVYEEQVRPRLDRAFAGERVSYELLRRNGSEDHYYAVRYEPTMADGEVTLVVVVVTDITERKTAEIVGMQKQAELQLILDTVPALVFYKDTESRFIRVNQELTRVVGALPEAFIGKTDTEMGVPQGEVYRQDDLRVMASGEPIRQLEEQIRTVEGIRWLLTDKFPRRDENGKIIGIIGFAVDITERKRAEAALQEREEQLRLYVEYSPAAIAMFDREMRYVVASRSWMERYRLGGESIVGRSHYDVFPEIPQRWKEVHRRCLGGAVEKCEEDAFPRSDGKTDWVRWEIRPWHKAEGSIGGIIIFSEDITQRKLAEDALVESEKKFRQLAENISDVFWIRTGDFQGMVYASPGYERIWGSTLDSLYAHPEQWIEAILPEDKERVVAEFTTLGESKTDVSMEYRIRCPDGTIHWINDRGFQVRDPSGGLERLTGIATDITERKNAEERIKEQAAFLDKAQDAILVRDLKGVILFWNEGARRIYGWSPDEAMGRNIGELLYADSNAFQELNARTIRQGEWHGELCHKTRDGRELIMEGRWTLIRDEVGNPKSILAINSDITEKKKIEAQFLRAQRMESIGTLAGGIAHDLNNILAPIMMSIEILKSVSNSPVAEKTLKAMEISARRGADIVGQVLSFARGMEGQRVEVQSKHLLKDLEHIIRDTFPKNVHMDFMLPEDAWMILGDPTQIHQILLNLCVNARDAMPHGGRLSISVENRILDEQYAAMNLQARPGAYVVITVSDTGTGIPRDILDKIFEPFFTTKEPNKGTGLGLSTVMAIVKSHGGNINVYSEPGKGSIFRVYLPAVEKTSGNPGDHPVPESLPRGNGETVLIVDDEASILTITGQTLEAFGYRVLTAMDGAEAVAVYAQRRREISVVLTDMMMPVMDGTITIQALTRIDPGVKIIAASGLNSNGAASKISGLGVKHFLMKPYTAGTLLKTLRLILEEN